MLTITVADFARQYLSTLLNRFGLTQTKLLAQIDVTTARQPHQVVSMEVRGNCLATTVGLSSRPMPLPVREGFQYFELCAFTERDSPAILWMLSNLGGIMLAAASPMFYGDPAQGIVDPAAFIAGQSILLGGDGERVLLVPRFAFEVPSGPPIEVVEPLPVTAQQWQQLAPLALVERVAWAHALGVRSMEQWRPILGISASAPSTRVNVATSVHYNSGGDTLRVKSDAAATVDAMREVALGLDAEGHLVGVVFQDDPPRQPIQIGPLEVVARWGPARVLACDNGDVVITMAGKRVRGNERNPYVVWTAGK